MPAPRTLERPAAPRTAPIERWLLDCEPDDVEGVDLERVRVEGIGSRRVDPSEVIAERDDLAVLEPSVRAVLVEADPGARVRPAAGWRVVGCCRVLAAGVVSRERTPRSCEEVAAGDSTDRFESDRAASLLTELLAAARNEEPVAVVRVRDETFGWLSTVTLLRGARTRLVRPSTVIDLGGRDPRRGLGRHTSV